MSLSRQLLLLIPAAFLLNYLWQLKGIWFCYPFAEVVAVLLFLFVAVKDYKKQFARKQKQYDEGAFAAAATVTETAEINEIPIDEDPNGNNTFAENNEVSDNTEE